MKIEKIEATASRDRVRLTFDDGSTMRVPLTVVGDLGLYPRMELDEAGLSALKEAAGTASAKLRAVRIVAASAVSEQELRRKLREKGETKAHTDEAVRWLEGLDLIDDEEAARRIVEKGLAKGYGRARLRQMLYEKGIPHELQEAALSDLPAPDEAIDRFLENRLGGREPDAKELKKITDALLRRGHSYGEIRAALRRRRLSAEEEFI